ncbi:M20/M25/M40 family metallo-hydrolase [Coraliomargarita sp. W4R53]
MNQVPIIEDLLIRLVRCPSVNPGAKGITHANEGESALVDLLRELLAGSADHIDIVEVVPGRPNLIARFDGPAGSPTYALEAHTDTVGVEGMAIEPFAAEIRERRLYGRGACDTKGPMAAMLHALLRAKQEFGTLPATWYFVASCDEELGGSGARAIAQSNFSCDGMIVAEPTELKLLTAHKGVLRFKLTISGKAAHSAYPERGSHSIHAAGSFIQGVKELNASFCEQWSEHLLGPPSISVGTIRGGDHVNRIPDHVEMEIDCRILAEQSADELVEVLLEIAEAAVEGDSELGYHLMATQKYPGLGDEADSSPHGLMEPLAELASHGYDHASYTTNAGFYCAVGIPVFVWGPGSIQQAHTADEWVDLRQVEQAGDLLYQLIKTTHG